MAEVKFSSYSLVEEKLIGIAVCGNTAYAVFVQYKNNTKNAHIQKVLVFKRPSSVFFSFYFPFFLTDVAL